MNKINSVLLVCIGNICRSPYAEIKLKEMVKNSKLDNFNISSIFNCRYLIFMHNLLLHAPSQATSLMK